MIKVERTVNEETLEVLDHPNVCVSAIEDPTVSREVSRFLAEMIMLTPPTHLPVYEPLPNIVDFRFKPILGFSVEHIVETGELKIYVKNWAKTIGLIEFPSNTDFTQVNLFKFLQDVKDIFMAQKKADEKYAREIEKRRRLDASRSARV